MIGKKVRGQSEFQNLAHMGMKLNMNELSSNLAKKKNTHTKD
jgi:hypothetical protein